MLLWFLSLVYKTCTERPASYSFLSPPCSKVPRAMLNYDIAFIFRNLQQEVRFGFRPSPRLGAHILAQSPAWPVIVITVLAAFLLLRETDGFPQITHAFLFPCLFLPSRKICSHVPTNQNMPFIKLHLECISCSLSRPARCSCSGFLPLQSIQGDALGLFAVWSSPIWCLRFRVYMVWAQVAFLLVQPSGYSSRSVRWE